MRNAGQEQVKFMIRGMNFWIAMAIFQVVFALAIFLVTRQYYISDSQNIDLVRDAKDQSTFELPDSMNRSSPTGLDSSTFNQSASDNPTEILRRADEAFANRRYDSAAKLYQRLLDFDPENVSTYNNLGLSLHYLGQSANALHRLGQGITVDPTHQRIWLTTGFVNSQLGNIDQARSALATAVKIGADNDIGRSAAEMLEGLP